MKAAFLSIFAITFLALSSGPAHGQKSTTEREIRTEQGENADVWVLDFKFKDPRIIKVFVPGEGTKVYWYLWYQVINRTPQPRKFVPYFEIVTIDFPAVYADSHYPTVEDAIKKLEDTTGYQNIKNSVTISSDLIPVSKADALPRAVTGLAIWEAASTANPKKRDLNKKELSDTTRFSIFVRGLSNGFVLVDPLAPGQPSITRFKTLQLNFRRTGDRYSLDSREISFLAPAEWLYRPGNTTILGAKDKQNNKK